jgi:hypothetical protein
MPFEFSDELAMVLPFAVRTGLAAWVKEALSNAHVKHWQREFTNAGKRRRREKTSVGSVPPFHM